MRLGLMESLCSSSSAGTWRELVNLVNLVKFNAGGRSAPFEKSWQDRIKSKLVFF